MGWTPLSASSTSRGPRRRRSSSQSGKVAALAQLRDRELDTAGPSVPLPAPIPPLGADLHARVHRRRPTARHATGDRWFVDETYVKVAGRWTYLYRAIDQHGQVIDVLVSERRDARGAGILPRALAGRRRSRSPPTGHRSTRGSSTSSPRPRGTSSSSTPTTRGSRSRPTQSAAAADARTEDDPLAAHGRGRSRVHAEPTPRPLRDHRRPASS